MKFEANKMKLSPELNENDYFHRLNFLRVNVKHIQENPDFL